MRISISGVRGIWNQELTVENVPSIARTVLEFFPENAKIAIARDTRNSSLTISYLLLATFSEYPIEVWNMGVCPTPLITFAIQELHLDGGIMITASHNPPEYNGFKFIEKKGKLFAPQKMESWKALFEAEQPQWSRKKNPSGFHTIDYNHILNLYMKKLKDWIHIPSIQEKKFRIVADVGNGALSPFLPYFFQELGVSVHWLHETMGGFERNPEPKPENLTALKKKVVETQSHLGFAYDPDGDRLAIVNEKGNPIGEDWTLGLAYLSFIQYNKAPILDTAINLSTSMIMENIADLYRAKVIRTKVGEIYVSQKLIDNSLLFGGEGNGGVIFTPLNFGRDALLASAFVLEFLSKQEKTCSEIIAEYPQYEKFSLAFPVQNESKLILQDKKEKIMQEIENIENCYIISVNEEDGLFISYSFGWIHIRFSNTEPILRVMGENKNKSIENFMIENIKLWLDL